MRKTVIVGLCILILAIGIFWLGSKTVKEPRQYRREVEMVLGEVKVALLRYKKDCGDFPKVESGFRAMANNLENCPTWMVPYWDKVPILDPWGREYFYKRQGSSTAIGSYGADGVDGGDGLDVDIIIEIE